MQNKLKHFILAVLFPLLGLGGFGLSGLAQTYPVTISTQLTQPSPIYLSNYANTTSINSPIKVQLILNDLTIMNRQVRLKCYFQGAVSFVSNDFVVGATPIYLEGGFPTQLTNVELGPYFEYQNLQGVNPNQYAQPLPEGIYTLSFEVYDFATNKKLSKKSSVTTIIFQNEPPFLNLPANNAGIVEQNIQNIIFSWTPRSINVSNVEYEFSLVEIWNTNTPLQNAFAYSQPLYTTTTRNTTVQYSIAEPQLIPGKTYAWRVKAKALVGAEEIGVFKNNGYSEIFSFKYLTFCKAPLAITTTDVSQDQAKVTWSGEVDNYDYQINYREKNADSKWYPLVTPREYATISNLKPKTTYEYTVGAACDPGEYTHSSIQEFTTLAQDEIAFAGCGIKPDPAALSNKTPLPALFPNDVVTAGDFPIVVLKSTGSNGTFSGEGYVTLPFLEKFKELIDAADALGGDKVNIGKYSRIRITFNNIGINTDFKLISGEIVASYDPNWGSMVDGDKLVNDVMGDTGTVIPIDVQFEIKSVVKNPDGSLTITGPNGVVVQLPKNENDVIITDRNGNQYAVSPNAPAGEIKSTGKAAPGGVPTPQNTNGMGSGGNIKEISSPDVTITFAAGTGFYSLDENPNQDSKLKANSKLNSTYDIIPKKDGSSYYVHYKVISDAPKAEDYVTAKATFSNGKTTADIVFKTENGTEIPSTWSGNIATLSLKRTLDFAKESILATVKPPVQKDSIKVTAKYDIAGTLNMWHVTGKKVNVTFVSVDGYKTPTKEEAESMLNGIYGKAGITFEVNVIKQNLNWPANLQCGNSGVFETYTDEQIKLIADFQSNIGSDYKNNTYYLFFSAIKPSRSLGGFMPLKRQFGFIFNGTSATEEGGGNTNKTIAHELGHGIFGLQHPFTEYNTTVTTDLLMDYGTGTALDHNDWEIMHAPGLQLYQFTQGSSAGEQIATTYNYILPNFQPFKFNDEDGKKSNDALIVNSNNNGGFPNGTLYSFTINNIDYVYKTNLKKFEPEYNNNYNPTDSKKSFRLIIQSETNSCIYYLVQKKIDNINDKLDLNLPNTAKPIVVCENDGKIPLNGKGDEFSTAEFAITFKNLKEQLGDNSVASEVLILDQKDPNYEQKLSDAKKNISYILATYDSTDTTVLKLEYKLEVPKILKGLFPNMKFDDKCTADYINKSLDNLHNSSIYKNCGLSGTRASLEVLTIFYQGYFGFYKCAFGEEKMADQPPAMQFVAGATCTAITSIDVLDLAKGLLEIIKTGTIAYAKSYIDYYKNLSQINSDFVAGQEIKTRQVLGVVLLPPNNLAPQLIDKAVTIATTFKDKYFVNCANLCWYRYGEVSVMAIPILLTAGEYIPAKIKEIADISKISVTLTKNVLKLNEKLIAKGVVLEESAGNTLIKNLEGTILKEVDGTDYKNIEIAIEKINSAVDNLVDDVSFEVIIKETKYLPGPQLPAKIASTFENSIYTNRKLLEKETYFKYHGVDNRTGRKYSWLTDKKYATEKELREGLAIRDDWGVKLESVTEFTIDAGTYVSEGKAAAQGIGYPGGDYQAVITNLSKNTIVRTDKAFSEIISTFLRKDGKFIDELLETDYNKYLSRKTKQDKLPKERLDWKEARDYWLFDSPMARGNAFNKKAVIEKWDRYNEVTLENGKRLDGYTPPTYGKAGEIVSRKATNLEDIELLTFEGYLKEMKTKYQAGESINAPKYGNELKGKVLEGNHILEIPSNNQSFSQIQDYIDLAKNKYNIEIRFKAE